MTASKTCPTCGAAFAPTGPNHQFCTPACRPCARPALAPDGRRKCAGCGKPFTRTGLAQRYCSFACRPSVQPEYAKRKYAARIGRPLKLPGRQPDLAKRARVAELRAAGWTLKQIGKAVGVGESSVSRMLKAIRKAAEQERPAAGER